MKKSAVYLVLCVGASLQVVLLFVARSLIGESFSGRHVCVTRKRRERFRVAGCSVKCWISKSCIGDVAAFLAFLRAFCSEE